MTRKVDNREEKLIAKRQDFPFLVRHPEWTYLDNAATTQKPRQVLWAQQNWYENLNANPLRGMYELSARATARYEAARATMAAWIGAETSEVIFTSGATMGLNLLALSQTETLTSQDEIVVTPLEHHSNYLPWLELSRRTGARLVYVTPEPDGQLTPKVIGDKLTAKTQIVAMTGMSNVLGQRVDLAAISALVHRAGARLVVDAAQLIAHTRINVKDLGIDALAFSGHKLYGPMGSGVLYISRDWAEQLRPVFVGGEMIESVSRDDYTPAPLPQAWEAGTVNAAGSVGLAVAVSYLEEVGFAGILAREKDLTEYLIKWLSQVSRVRILGSPTPVDHAGVVSFVIDDVHPHDVASVLADGQIAVRAGHHCAALTHEFLGVPASTRISLCWYNTREEIDRVVGAIASVRRRLGYE